MSDELAEARDRVAALEKQGELEQAVADAAQAYEADPSEEAYQAHNRATEALAEHRAAQRPAGGVSVGGDATVSSDGEE